MLPGTFTVVWMQKRENGERGKGSRKKERERKKGGHGREGGEQTSGADLPLQLT